MEHQLSSGLTTEHSPAPQAILFLWGQVKLDAQYYVLVEFV